MGFNNFIVEGDSNCVIRWASRSADSPWHMADICKELALKLNLSFSLVKLSANETADELAKKGVGRENILGENS